MQQAEQTFSQKNQSGTNNNPKDFFSYIFLTVLIGMIFVMLLGIIINPRGSFGTKLLKPIVTSERAEKIDLINNLTFSPNIIVLGSSTAMKFNPKLISNLTNETSFNAAVSDAHTEDIYAELAYFIQNRHSIPKTIIVGLEIDEFSDSDPVDPTLFPVNMLSDKLENQSPTQILNPYLNTLSRSYLEDDFRSITYSIYGYPPGLTQLDRLGYETYRIKDPQKENGTFNLSANLDLSGICISRDAGMTELSEVRKTYFESFLSLAKINNITVLLVSPPFSQQCLNVLKIDPNYQNILNERLKYLNSLKARYNFIFNDFTDIKTFDGNPDGFYDSVHADPTNIDPITRRLLSGNK